MKGLDKWFPSVTTARRIVDVGWLLQTDRASFIWDSPRSIARIGKDTPGHAKSVAYCPAVLDHEARLVELPCPFDLTLHFRFGDKGEGILVDAGGDQSSLRPAQLKQLVFLSARKEWRHPERPIMQIATPYIFLADEPVYLVEMPPFAHYRSPRWPGLMIGGRMPIHIWPRALSWAFEWYDLDKPLTLTRGEPWFYLRFETSDPARPTRVVEAELTPELKTYLAGINGVTNYVSRTFSLFATAQKRRPKKLLTRVRRSGAAEQEEPFG